MKSEPDRPLEISLGIPSEKEAAKQLDLLRDWVAAWKRRSGAGTVVWRELRWSTLGTQCLPDKLVFSAPADVVSFLGETANWECFRNRASALLHAWPQLSKELPRHFRMLAQYSDLDFRNLIAVLDWLAAHPNSGLYPRNLPVAGMDSKWIESQKGILSALLAAIQGRSAAGMGFHESCGLRPLPHLLRMRVLDANIRKCFGGLGDLSSPVD